VPYRLAADLKKVMLLRLNPIVTFVLSSRNANCSGSGRKSGMIFSGPMGSFVYLMFFIYFLSFPPVSGSDDPYHVISISKADRHNAVADFAKTIKPDLCLAVGQVLRYDSL
jgi:hypothetical protein